MPFYTWRPGGLQAVEHTYAAYDDGAGDELDELDDDGGDELDEGGLDEDGGLEEELDGGVELGDEDGLGTDEGLDGGTEDEGGVDDGDGEGDGAEELGEGEGDGYDGMLEDGELGGASTVNVPDARIVLPLRKASWKVPVDAIKTGFSNSLYVGRTVTLPES